MSELPNFSEDDTRNIGDITEVDLFLHTGYEATVRAVRGAIDIVAGLNDVFEHYQDSQIIEATRRKMEEDGTL